MLDGCEKTLDSLGENSLFHSQELPQFEMDQFWNESLTYLSDELCSNWPTSDNCCCIGRYDNYDADYSISLPNDYTYCVMGHHKTLNPLLKDSFLTTPLMLDTRKGSVSILEDGTKIDDTKCRETLLEEMASADLTTYCVDPNEIFCSGQLSKLGFVAVDSRNSSAGSGATADFSTVICSGSTSYEDMWSDSDSDELPSSSQPSGELNFLVNGFNGSLLMLFFIINVIL